MHYKYIWHIDDDEDDQEFFQIALKQVSPNLDYKGYIYAENALKELQVAGSLPDMIFLDLNMPGMNGEQFLKQIKQESELSTIPVIIFTTSSQKNTMERMKALGASKFLTKPDNYLHLIELLKNVLQ